MFQGSYEIIDTSIQKLRENDKMHQKVVKTNTLLLKYLQILAKWFCCNDLAYLK